MKRIIVYVHGKGGSANEAEHYEPLFPGCEVVGFDYRSQTPWDAKEEFCKFFEDKRAKCDYLTLVANSIGAFLSMCALDESLVDNAYFISPVADMEKLICDMMKLAGINETDLSEESEITTNFGETLSWEYLSYVRNHPISWRVPTYILYGEHDNLTSYQTISDFAKRHGADLTVMCGGEHWFHTEEEMRFIDDWIRKKEKKHGIFG